MKRGLQLTMSTIVIILILLITMIAIVVFFGDGFSAVSGDLMSTVTSTTTASSEARGEGAFNPCDWLGC